MKLFNVEEGKEVVYIQFGDLAKMMRICNSMPAAFLTDFFSEPRIINEDNWYEFYRMENPIEIEYIKEQDWIIDYHDFSELSEDRIKGIGQIVLEEMNYILTRYNSSLDEIEKELLGDRYKLLQHKFDSIKEFIWRKQGHINYVIPTVKEEMPKKTKSLFRNLFKRK